MAWDVDLAFGCHESVGIEVVKNDFTQMMEEKHDVIHTLDVPWQSWLIKFFCYQIPYADLAFVPTSDFGAKAESFEACFWNV